MRYFKSQRKRKPRGKKAKSIYQYLKLLGLKPLRRRTIKDLLAIKKKARITL